MRVLMTTDCVGGVWTYTMTLCRALQRHGVEITLAITGGPMSNAQTREVDQIANVDWHHRPYRCEWMQPPLADVAAAGEWLESLWDECVPDVVHLNDFAHGNRWFGHCPRLIVWHSDVVSWHRDVLGREPGRAWQGYQRALQEGTRGADAIVWIDGDFGISELFDDPIKACIPNAIELAAVPHEDRRPFILAAGRVWDEAKNLRVLCEAAADLSWPVRIAGNNTHPDDNGSSSIAGLQIRNVDFLGSLSKRELHELMAQAAIFCAPAKYEPFGLAIAEAAALGCALVVSYIPSLSERWWGAEWFDPSPHTRRFVQDFGEPAPPLRSTLQALIDDPILRQANAAKWRDVAREFSPSVQADRYLDLYRRLIERGRQPAA